MVTDYGDIFPDSGAAKFNNELTKIAFGRENDIRRCRTFFDRVVQGTGANVLNLIIGTVGSGKSHLVFHFLREILVEDRYKDIIPIFVSPTTPSKADDIFAGIGKDLTFNLELGSEYTNVHIQNNLESSTLKTIQISIREKAEKDIIKDLIFSYSELKIFGLNEEFFIQLLSESFENLNDLDTRLNILAQNNKITEKQKELIIKRLRSRIQESSDQRIRNMDDLKDIFRKIIKFLPPSKKILVFWEEVERAYSNLPNRKEKSKFLSTFRSLYNFILEEGIYYVLIIETGTYNRISIDTRSWLGEEDDPQLRGFLDIFLRQGILVNTTALNRSEVSKILEYCIERIAEKHPFTPRVKNWLIRARQGNIRHCLADARKIMHEFEDTNGLGVNLDQNQYQVELEKVIFDFFWNKQKFFTYTDKKAIYSAINSYQMPSQIVSPELITLLAISTQQSGFSPAFSENESISYIELEKQFKELTLDDVDFEVIKQLENKNILAENESDKTLVIKHAFKNLLTVVDTETTDSEILRQFINNLAVATLNSTQIWEGIFKIFSEIILEFEEIDAGYLTVEPPTHFAIGNFSSGTREWKQSFKGAKVAVAYYDPDCRSTLIKDQMDDIKRYCVENEILVFCQLGHHTIFPLEAGESMFMDFRAKYHYEVDYSYPPQFDEINLIVMDIENKFSLPKSILSLLKSRSHIGKYELWRFLSEYSPRDSIDIRNEDDLKFIDDCGEQILKDIRSDFDKKITEKFKTIYYWVPEEMKVKGQGSYGYIYALAHMLIRENLIGMSKTHFTKLSPQFKLKFGKAMENLSKHYDSSFTLGGNRPRDKIQELQNYGILDLQNVFVFKENEYTLQMLKFLETEFGEAEFGIPDLLSKIFIEELINVGRKWSKSYKHMQFIETLLRYLVSIKRLEIINESPATYKLAETIPADPSSIKRALEQHLLRSLDKYLKAELITKSQIEQRNQNLTELINSFNSIFNESSTSSNKSAWVHQARYILEDVNKKNRVLEEEYVKLKEEVNNNHISCKLIYKDIYEKLVNFGTILKKKDKILDDLLSYSNPKIASDVIRGEIEVELRNQMKIDAFNKDYEKIKIPPRPKTSKKFSIKIKKLLQSATALQRKINTNSIVFYQNIIFPKIELKGEGDNRFSKILIPIINQSLQKLDNDQKNFKSNSDLQYVKLASLFAKYYLISLDSTCGLLERSSNQWFINIPDLLKRVNLNYIKGNALLMKTMNLDLKIPTIENAPVFESVLKEVTKILDSVEQRELEFIEILKELSPSSAERRGKDFKSLLEGVNMKLKKNIQNYKETVIPFSIDEVKKNEDEFTNFILERILTETKGISEIDLFFLLKAKFPDIDYSRFLNSLKNLNEKYIIVTQQYLPLM